MIDLLSAHQIVSLIASYGYWAVLLVVVAESSGVPLPGETTLLAASVYAGATHKLNVLLVIAAAAGGPSWGTTSASFWGGGAAPAS